MNDANAKLVASSQRPGSGLDYLQRIISGEYAQLPIGEHLGFRIAAAEPGKVTLKGLPDERSYNLLKSVHGGWTAAILDTAMALSNLTVMLDPEAIVLGGIVEGDGGARAVDGKQNCVGHDAETSRPSGRRRPRAA